MWHFLQIDQFSLGMGSRDFFLQDEYEERREAYKTFIQETAMYLNGTESTVKQDVEALLEFETYLANVSILNYNSVN